MSTKGQEWKWCGEERKFNEHDRMCIKIGIDLDKKKNINCFAMLVNPALNFEEDMRLIDEDEERPLPIYYEDGRQGDIKDIKGYGPVWCASFKRMV